MEGKDRDQYFAAFGHFRRSALAVSLTTVFIASFFALAAYMFSSLDLVVCELELGEANASQKKVTTVKLKMEIRQPNIEFPSRGRSRTSRTYLYCTLHVGQ